MKLSAGALALLALLSTECGGTTGGHLIQVPFEAGGIARDTTTPFTFSTGQGWTVTLTEAKVVLGPLYFNVAAPQPSVFRSGVVIMQVTSQFIVDMLDPTLQAVAGGADGQTGTAISVEIGFYTSVNGYNDTISPGAPLVTGGQQGTAFLAGTATKAGVAVPFAGRVQISSALVTALNPIDRLARVAGADCNLVFTSSSGALELRVDPSHWFDQANFCNLVTPPPKPAAPDGGAPDAGAAGADAGAVG
ncbi:MAG TPA: hypothetical protein VHO67_03710, partial [Polyangia bacterium]|nr:hypothetical protein [Polyangia bacterium]